MFEMGGLGAAVDVRQFGLGIRPFISTIRTPSSRGRRVRRQKGVELRRWRHIAKISFRL